MPGEMSLSTLDLTAVRRPVAEANGLPNALYVDPAVFEEEKRRVFDRTWAAIGFAKDLPAPGDAVPITFLGNPLLAVRDRDGTVRVFQNVCRHRGMILVQEKTRLKGIIRCPYHSWCYGLDGSLRSTPYVGGPDSNTHEAIRNEELGLLEVRSHVFRDVIFVNVSGDAPPFEEHAAALIARWAPFDKPLHHSGPDSAFTLEVDCNWKLAVENYAESYHLPFVHPGLNAYSRLEDHYHIEVPGAFSGQGTRVYKPTLLEGGPAFPDFPGLGAEWDTAAEYVCFFPNVLFGAHRDHAYAILLEPLGLERTAEHVSIYYADEAALDDDHAELRRRNTELWRGVFVEDVGVVEGMQKGRHGRAFDGGRFSPVMDGPTHVFHDWIASRWA